MRASGILLPIFSLPGKYGVGCFSKEAYKFIDFLKECDQKYWQILPIGPTSYGDSPYQSFSTFAGNPYFISLEDLIEQGLLTKAECDGIDFGKNSNEVDYEKLYKHRFKLLRKAYERSEIYEKEEFHKFKAENEYWLKDYAIFMAVKDRFGGKSFDQWATDICNRWGYSMEYYQKELYFDIEFYEFVQYEFYRQWFQLKEYANKKGVFIIGDIPIYVAYDSADVWAHPELFQLNDDKKPQAVSGCPPDGFSERGQLWGNSLYQWNYHQSTNYDWWIKRIEKCSQLYDVIRIDHFRGFDEYFSIPYGATTAREGHWEKGPAIELFRCIENRLGWHEVIAEDLGYVTDSVRHLVQESGFPGMKVLEFAFDSRDTGSANDYLPHNYIENSVAYTGTHDNETIVGWFDSITEEERELARNYLCDHYTPKELLYKSFISLAMRSNSKTCIIPMQDYLGYDNSCRINQPSTVGKNWKWRLTGKELTDDLKQEILAITKRYGRMNWD